MWKAVLQPVKATFPMIAGLFSALVIINPALSQQNIIANKDNTRPEITRQYNSSPARISAFAAIKLNGYNDIQWNAVSEQNTRKFIVEYSYDGINFQSAGEVLAGNGLYELKHYTQDTRPLLYRVRIEELNGRFHYSDLALLDGIALLPVEIYPTVVTGNVMNVNAVFPVERINVISAEGQQMFAKDLNGEKDFFRVNIPSLNKGMYLITFYGNGWKTTSKFIVG
jgi:hypothetical protein